MANSRNLRFHRLREFLSCQNFKIEFLKKKNDIIQRVSGGVSIKIRKFESTEECKLINEPFWLKSEFRNVY